MIAGMLKFLQTSLTRSPATGGLASHPQGEPMARTSVNFVGSLENTVLSHMQDGRMLWTVVALDSHRLSRLSTARVCTSKRGESAFDSQSVFVKKRLCVTAEWIA